MFGLCRISPILCALLLTGLACSRGIEPPKVVIADEAKKNDLPGVKSEKDAEHSPKKKKSIPPLISDEITRAWREAGARISWLDLTSLDSERSRSWDDPYQEGWVPTFSFFGCKAGALKNLPSPQFEFAVTFSSSESIDHLIKDLQSHQKIISIWITESNLPEIAFFEITRLQGIKHLHASGRGELRLTDKVMVALSKLPHLETLELSLTEYPSGLSEFKNFKKLTSLQLKIDGFVDKSLSEVCKIKKLKALTLSINTGITTEGLKHLGELDELAFLRVGGANITDNGMEEICKLKNLSGLGLSGSRITDAGLMKISNLENLTLLDLSFEPIGPKVTDIGVREIAKLSKLRSLFLSYARITDVGARELANLKNLQVLYIGPALQVSDVGFREIAKLNRLQELNIGGLAATDNGLSEISNLVGLTSLTLAGTKVSDGTMKELGKLNHLVELNLNSCKLITDSGLKDIGNLKSLKRLDIADTGITDSGLGALSGLRLSRLEIPNSAKTNLGFRHYLAAIMPPTNLHLSKWQITEEGLRNLSNTDKLKTLSLERMQITADGLKELAKLKALVNLILVESKITDADAGSLAQLQQLRTLSLFRTPISDNAIEKLRKALPNCAISR